jgi:stage III sporulation protein SpoIIIAA
MEKNQTTPGAERRAAPRLPIQIKFKYRTIGQRGEAEVLNSAASKNISSAGLLFENEKQIPIDTEMQLVLILPGAALMTIDAQAKVTRVEKISPGSFDIGVAFTAISEKDRDVLKDLIERMDIIKLLSKVNKKEISDVHLTANSPPMIRYYGEIKPLNNQPLTAEEVRQMVYSILNEEQRKGLVADKDLDFIFAPNPDLRYRVSIYQQRGTPEVVFRVILPTIKSREELGLPQVIEELCQFKDGIIFITGPTGSGKTTTITTMIDIINRTRGGVILSLEKPIEYLHTNIKGVVKQREVGKDVATFASGLKAALRQDSDVIVVGEILDADTIETALQAAETGH